MQSKPLSVLHFCAFTATLDFVRTELKLLKVCEFKENYSRSTTLLLIETVVQSFSGLSLLCKRKKTDGTTLPIFFTYKLSICVCLILFAGKFPTAPEFQL